MKEGGRDFPPSLKGKFFFHLAKRGEEEKGKEEPTNWLLPREKGEMRREKAALRGSNFPGGRRKREGRQSNPQCSGRGKKTLHQAWGALVSTSNPPNKKKEGHAPAWIFLRK